MFETTKLPDLQEKSASGSVASFNTALAAPLVSCNMAVNALQEGSGDPYPAGGTAQIWDEVWELGFIKTDGTDSNDANSIRSKNYCYCDGGDTYYAKSFASPTMYICWYDSSNGFISRSIANNNTITAPTNASYFRLSCYGYGTTYKNDISINYPATDTAYHAYSNERPIHGFSEVNATRAGKNLLNGVSGSRSDVTINYDSTTGEYTINGTATSNWLYSIELPYVLPAGNYVISAINQPSDIVIRLQNSNGVTAATLNIDSANSYRPYTTNYNVSKYIIRINGGTTYTNYKLKLQLEAGNTKTSFEPYVTPTIYLIKFAEEVYGAEIDAVNGVAHVTHGYREFDGTEGWIDATVSGFSCFQIARGVLPTSAQFISNYIKRVAAMTASEYIGYIGGSNFNVRFTSDTTLTLFQKILWHNNMQIVYELAEPFDIQLTPTQIATIQGNNTIFADTGDIDLTYKDCDLAKRGDFRQVFKIPD